MRTTLISLMLATSLTSAPVFAQSMTGNPYQPTPNYQTSPRYNPQPASMGGPEHTEVNSRNYAQPNNGIAVLSGGVGMADRAQIEAQQNNYSTKIVFSGQGGAFVSGVMVNVKDSKGNGLVTTTTDGPILLVNLPKGSYTVEATVEGTTKTSKITATSSLKTYNMVFPVADDAELTSPGGGYRPKMTAPVEGGYYAPAPRRAGY